MKLKFLQFLLWVLVANNLYAGLKPVNGDWYYIKGAEDKYISFESDAKKFVMSGPDKKTKFKIVKRDDGKIFLQLANQQYLSASDDRTVTVRPNPWGWEAFALEEAPHGDYYLKSVHGKYLIPNYESILVLEGFRAPFEFLKAPEELLNEHWYYLKGPDNKYVSLDSNDRKFVLGTADKKTAFKIIKNDGKIFLQLAEQQYLSASDDGTVTVRQNPWGWETFTLEEAPDGKYYLHSFHGNYLSINADKNILDLSAAKGRSQALKFINIAKDKAPSIPTQEKIRVNFTFVDSDKEKPEEFEIDKDIMQMIKSLDLMILDLGGYESLGKTPVTIPLVSIKSAVFKKIIDILAKAKKRSSVSSSSASQQEIIETILAKYSRDELIDIIIAANFLDVPIVHAAAKLWAQGHAENYQFADIEKLEKMLPSELKKLLILYAIEDFSKKIIPDGPVGKTHVKIITLNPTGALVEVGDDNPTRPTRFYDKFGTIVFTVPERILAISPDRTFGVRAASKYDHFMQEYPVIFSLKDGTDLQKIPSGAQSLKAKISKDNNLIMLQGSGSGSIGHGSEIWSKEGNLVARLREGEKHDLLDKFGDAPEKDPALKYTLKRGHKNTTDVITHDGKVVRTLKGEQIAIGQIDTDTMLVVTGTIYGRGPLNLWNLNLQDPYVTVGLGTITLPQAELIASAFKAHQAKKEFTIDADYLSVWNTLDEDVRKNLVYRYNVKIPK